jgi:large subunit ribosomal protein L10
MATAAAYKRKVVGELAEAFLSARVVGVVKIHGIPAKQMQRMRRKLADKAKLRVTKNNLLRRALEEAAAKRPGLEKLGALIEGPTAVVTADMNPFLLYRELEATKTPAPARGGEVAPEDIVIREGDTPFKPGPVVGELQRAGIPAAIERGKVVVKRDELLVPKGERIPRAVAHALTRLEIHPLIVGLDMQGAYEDGVVFAKDVLSVDEGRIRGDLALAARHAVGLSLAAAFPTEGTTSLLLSRAYGHALSLALKAAWPAKDAVKLLLAKGHAQMLALAARTSEAVDKDATKGPGGVPSAEETPKEEEKKDEGKEGASEEAASDSSSRSDEEKRR